MEIEFSFPGLAFGMTILHWNPNGVWELFHTFFSINNDCAVRLSFAVGMEWIVFDQPFRSGYLNGGIYVNGNTYKWRND